MRLVLGSGSPRRRELLTLLGWPFVVQRPDIDETPFPAEAADQYVARLSREKALAISAEPDDWIIASDTTVALDGTILGKPADPREATTMLSRLRNRDHLVHTGVTLRVDSRLMLTTSVTTTRVTMRNYSDDEIAQYVASREPFDKAGGYAIQDTRFHPVSQISGCYANVMGLPLCRLQQLFFEQDQPPPGSIPCHFERPCVAEQSN